MANYFKFIIAKLLILLISHTRKIKNKYKNKNNIKYTARYSQEIKFGVLMMIISMFNFSLMAILVKLLKHIPLMEVTIFRNLPSFLILPFIIKLNCLPFFGIDKLVLLLRALFGFITTIGLIYTFMKMNLTDAMALRQLSPFIIVILSQLFLREKIRPNQLIIFSVAFVGALLIIKPGFRSDMFPAIVGLIATLSSSLAHITLRKLRLTDHPLVIVYIFSILSIIFSFTILLVEDNFYFPNGVELLLLILTGLTGFFTQFTLSYAYRFASANIVSIYIYSSVLFTAILDFIFFHEIPDYFSIIGCILIIIGGYIHSQNEIRIKN
ncbi:MAG: DMT family transporter [Atribacterota bacterium]|nr:DMT family transporter [Atribacterota bacterium]